MVLEQKNTPGDYGSFENTQLSGGGGGCSNPRPSSPGTTEALTATSNTELVAASEAGAIIDQSQPLLPAAEDWDEAESRVHYTSSVGASGAASPRKNGSSTIKIDIPAPSREEPRFPKEKLKTCFAFLFAFTNMVLTTITLALVHERVPDPKEVGPLSDVILDNFGQDWMWGLYISEILIMVSTVATVLVIFFHKHRFIVMRRVFLIVGLLYLMRCFTMYVTVLPMSNKVYPCAPKANTTSVLLIVQRSLKLLSGFGLSINGQHAYCGDYIYSGHTVILVMCYLIIQEYTPRRCLLFHWLAWLSACAGMILILIAKSHYTVDVIIAYYVTTRLFWIYHTMANNREFKQRAPNNFLSRVWWFFMFRYFEKNVSGVVPRQFEWPLPRRFFAKHPNRDS